MRPRGRALRNYAVLLWSEIGQPCLRLCHLLICICFPLNDEINVHIFSSDKSVSENPCAFFSHSGFGFPFRFLIRSTAMFTESFCSFGRKLNSQGAKLELYGGCSKMAKFYLSLSSVVVTRSLWPVLSYRSLPGVFNGSVLKNSVLIISFLYFSV